jgi:hypothetical protein
LAACVVDASTVKHPPPHKKPPPKKSPPRHPPPHKKPPPKRASPPPPSPPPPTPDCTKNGTGFYNFFNATINATQCISIPLQCANGGYNDVNTGNCICPVDANGNPITDGPSDGCGTCQVNLDPNTQCTTILDPCTAYNVTYYATNGKPYVNDIYTTYPNATSQAYCDQQAEALGAAAGTLQCQTNFSSIPTTFYCACPPGSTFNKKLKTCVDVNECVTLATPGANGPIDPCYFTSTTQIYNVDLGPVINTTSGDVVINATTGLPVQNIVQYNIVPAMGPTCVNMIWSYDNQGVSYNCTCPPCYYASVVDDNGVVQACDPLPSCQLTQTLKFDLLYTVLANQSAIDTHTGEVITFQYNADGSGYGQEY